MMHLHHLAVFYSLNTLTCSFSLYMKRLWRMSWQHTSIWSWERRNNQLNTSWLRTRGIMSGERLGNVIAYLRLSKEVLVRHHRQWRLRSVMCSFRWNCLHKYSISCRVAHLASDVFQNFCYTIINIGNWWTKTLHGWILSARSDLHPEIPTLQFRSRLIDMITRWCSHINVR